ncbi:hypothetical protein ACFPU1_12855 [Thalassorhabdus alkalitolerans]|uniref:Uncharacterized protein n=1 Tax=Thalassorhabdus alkalitolerans TaxID=2282697 RepID=A0ABW0YMF9_9BACI
MKKRERKRSLMYPLFEQRSKEIDNDPIYLKWQKKMRKLEKKLKKRPWW